MIEEQRRRQRSRPCPCHGHRVFSVFRAFFIVTLITICISTSTLFATTATLPYDTAPPKKSKNYDNSSHFVIVPFKVSGSVQGVHFRKYTKSKAEELGLTGWCRNTPEGTVEGEFEYVDNAPDDTNAVVGNVATGPKQQNPQFRHWLRHVGSPQSRIDGCIFSGEMVSPTREQIRLLCFSTGFSKIHPMTKDIHNNGIAHSYYTSFLLCFLSCSMLHLENRYKPQHIVPP